MARQNRVTPTGEIVAVPLRGDWMGNRGELHDDERIVRPWRERRWIICRTSYRDRAVPQWAAGLYTPLFFHDEAVALAAGHRPCAECRRDRYHDFLDRWEAVTGGRPKADELDVVLHHSRLTDDGEQRVHSREWPSLPDGTFVRHDGTPALVAGDAVVPWGPNGYGDHEPRPREGTAEVLTPSPTVDVLAAGYRPHISDTALVGGHVFIVAGDITDLHCDAWLLPTDSAVNISDSFCHVAPDHAVAEARRRGFGASRALRMPAARDGDSSTAWLTNIGTVGPDVATYLDGVDAFVTEAVRDLSHLRTREHRRPVLALPVVGTGEGGAVAEKAEVLQALLPALDRWADHHHTDLVLVTKDKPSYAAAQRTRQKSLGHRSTGDRTRSSLWRIGPEDAATERLHDIAETLAAAARAGHLTLFVGAGSSLASGLPGWRKLLANLAAKISQEPGLAERLEKLDLRDQASLLQRRFERYELTADGLGPAIAEELAGHQPSLVHQLLASLPVREMVTTNFDELLERAVAAVDGTTPAILPFDAATSSDRWILKLHGTVDRPETIVLTRDDYLRTSVTHGALLGLVQALLVTRHMLFVGYSLSDEDFHQLVHEIRSALPGRDPMGTALLLEPDDLLADLWAADLNLVPMEPPSTGIESPARASGVRSRRVQILLDLVGYLAADLSHFVLDETYAALLDEDEKDLRDQLNSLAGLLGRSDASITEPLRQTLERYGLAEK